MGEVRVPADARWGAQTQRAVENFPISGDRDRPARSSARSRRSRAAAARGQRPARGDRRRTSPTRSTPRPPRSPPGAVDDQFPIDVFQTGSGTSSNMNANEVIASLASRAARARPVHPNDHVNASQSSNDVFPSAIHLAARRGRPSDLVPALEQLERRRCARRQREFADRREVGPHAPDGRHARHPRPGVRRLRRAGRDGHRAPRTTRCRGSARCRSAAPRSAPASTRRRRSPAT